jgi:hypothetical protein
MNELINLIDELIPLVHQKAIEYGDKHNMLTGVIRALEDIAYGTIHEDKAFDIKYKLEKILEQWDD